jgi:FkbM family methyltransferase
MFHELLRYYLARQPLLYKRLLLFKGSGQYNFDKIIFLSLIRDGDTVFDVGANLGFYTLLFSHMVGRNGKVHAFEPVPKTFALLKEQIVKRRRSQNVVLNQLALGEYPAQLDIHVPGADLGQASLVKHKSGSWATVADSETTTYAIQVQSLDTYTEENQTKRLDFLKIDVEGYELLCLKGGERFLKESLPLIYLEIFEAWSSDLGYSAPDIVRFLMAIGYTKFYIVTNNVEELTAPEAQLSSNRLLSGPANLLCAVLPKHAWRLKNLV